MPGGAGRQTDPVRKLLVTLAVLVVIGAALDIGGRLFTESRLASEISTRSGITPAPSVDIGGFSFLWQVVTGDYQHVSVDFPSTTVGGLQGVQASVDGYDLSLPLSQAVRGDVDQLTAGRADLRAVLPTAGLFGQLDGTDLAVSPGEGSSVRVSTTQAVAGRTFTLSADVKAEVRDNTLVLTGGTVSGLPAGVPASVSSGFLRGLSLRIPLTGLPFGISSGSVTSQDGALVLTGTATDVPIGTLIRYSQQGR